MSAAPLATWAQIEAAAPVMADVAGCPPGKRVPRATTNTLAYRLGTLRMFFVRIDEWDSRRMSPW